MKLKTPIPRIAATAFCLLAFSPGLVFGAGFPKLREGSGAIKSVDATAHILVVTDRKTNSDHTFQWNDQTKFSEGGKVATPAEIKAGERVRITYTPSPGTPIARRVLLAPVKHERPANTGPSQSRSRKTRP